MQKEMQELEECTFKPDVHPVPPKEKEPVVIKGLGRHLELQDLAKQMRKDQEEWERKVFFTHVSNQSHAKLELESKFLIVEINLLTRVHHDNRYMISQDDSTQYLNHSLFTAETVLTRPQRLKMSSTRIKPPHGLHPPPRQAITKVTIPQR